MNLSLRLKTITPNFWRVDNTNRARSQYTFFIENGSRGCASRTTYTQNRHRVQNRVLYIHDKNTDD